MAENGEFEEEALIYAFILILRFLDNIEDGSPINFLKLTATAVFVAQKILFDTGIWKITDFAEIAGLSASSLKKLEIEFMQDLNYKLHVDKQEYLVYSRKLTKRGQRLIYTLSEDRHQSVNTDNYNV